jgi:hypothetical protein
MKDLIGMDGLISVEAGVRQTDAETDVYES